MTAFWLAAVIQKKPDGCFLLKGFWNNGDVYFSRFKQSL